MFSFQGASRLILRASGSLPLRFVFDYQVSLSRNSMKPRNFFRCFSQFLYLEVVGQNGLEPSTSRLSVVCSSQLSYWPILVSSLLLESTSSYVPSKLNNASISKTLCTDLRTLPDDALLIWKSP